MLFMCLWEIVYTQTILRPLSCGHETIANSMATTDLFIWFAPRVQPNWSPRMLSLVLTLRLLAVIQQSRAVSACFRILIPEYGADFVGRLKEYIAPAHYSILPLGPGAY